MPSETRDGERQSGSQTRDSSLRRRYSRQQSDRIDELRRAQPKTLREMASFFTEFVEASTEVFLRGETGSNGRFGRWDAAGDFIQSNLMSESDSLLIQGAVKIEHRLATILTIEDGGPSGVTPATQAEALFIDADVASGITIATLNSQAGCVHFGDPENNAAGTICYDHSSDVLSLTTLSKIGFGTTAPATDFHFLQIASGTVPAVEIEQLGSGDAALQFSIAGDAYALGIDNSDNDLLKFSYAAGAGTAVLGTGDVLTIDGSGNMVPSGTVDGRDLAVDGTKLDAIEASADVTDFANVDAALNGNVITNFESVGIDDDATSTAITIDSSEQSIFAGDAQFQKRIIVKNDGELTISSGSITITGSFHRVDTESDDATDDLTDIAGGVDGQLLFLRTVNGARDVTYKNNTGSTGTKMRLTGDHVSTSTADLLVLRFDSSLSSGTWVQISFSDNA